MMLFVVGFSVAISAAVMVLGRCRRRRRCDGVKQSASVEEDEHANWSEGGAMRGFQILLFWTKPLTASIHLCRASPGRRTRTGRGGPGRSRR